MDNDAFEAAARRIVEDNQKARRAASDRTSRLMDVLIQGDRDKFTEAVNDIIDNATGSKEKDGQVLGPDGEAQPSDGSDHG